MLKVGIIGGTQADFDFEWLGDRRVETPYGQWVTLSVGRCGDNEIYLLKRHGEDHERLSSQVDYRANIWALSEVGCDAIIGTTVCGVLDPKVALGAAVVFDDLFFPDNRLPDGSACTMFEQAGEPGRGHYIFGSPFSANLRRALLAGAETAGAPVVREGTYAYSVGPRFNTRSEIAWMRSVGAIAVSQTAGPEAVLAGELEIPYALLGFGVDYANGVNDQPTPVEVLNANIGASKSILSGILATAIAALESADFDSGFVYRFE